MRTPEEIRKTPVLLLTEEEIGTLSPESQQWARASQAQHRREQACPKHEPIATPNTEAYRMRGWHPAKCKHCGIDMSIDSGD